MGNKLLLKMLGSWEKVEASKFNNVLWIGLLSWSLLRVVQGYASICFMVLESSWCHFVFFTDVSGFGVRYVIFCFCLLCLTIWFLLYASPLFSIKFKFYCRAKNKITFTPNHIKKSGCYRISL